MPTDEEFRKALRATFEAEAEEHLQGISSMLLELEKSASSPQGGVLTENVYRELHSLKGAARAVDLPEIERICQSLESVFSVCKREKLAPQADVFDALHRAMDMIRARLPSTETNRAGDQSQYDELIQQLGQLQSNIGSLAEMGNAQPRPEVTATPIALPPSSPPDSERSTETVRISVEKLDAQLRQAEEMLSIKATTVQRARDMRELVGLFGEWRGRWAKFANEMRTSPVLAKAGGNGSSSVRSSSPFEDFLQENADYFRSMENRLTTMTVQSEQDRHRVAKHVDELLEDSKKLLMMPFSTLAGVFPILLRDLCRQEDKDAELTLQGGEIEIDKRILDEIKDPIIHLVRNCVSHGLETREARTRAGKPEKATLVIAAAPFNGNKVQISISDDGAGIDVERVKKSAIHHGVISDGEARQMNHNSALSLVFHSDVSTSQTVTTLSGRGLGMAIVQSKVEKLGGQVSIESHPGKGTTVRMVLPLALAALRGVLISAAGRVFILPTVNVECVLRVAPGEIATVENRETVLVQGKPVSLVRMADVLELAVSCRDEDSKAAIPVVVLHSADQRIAMAVDAVMHEEEILAKPLRKPLLRVRNIAGATILGSGKVVPILNAADLMKSARKCGAAPQRVAAAQPQGAEKKKRLLVVEDSVTSRMLLKGILESAGYEVKTAIDGAEALAVLRESEFDLVVSDVEMPRMNGLDLTARIRSDKRLAELPVVLVTALESREHREGGIDAGANAYIVKSGFDQNNLLEAVHRLI